MSTRTVTAASSSRRSPRDTSSSPIPRYADQLRRVIGVKKREGLSKSMMETLAIIAYKQPIVLAEIDELRGVVLAA